MTSKTTNVDSLESILLLKDGSFLKLFPGIDNVAGFMASAADGYESQGQKYPIFRELEIKNIGEYISLVEQNHPRAKVIYIDVKRILRF